MIEDIFEAPEPARFPPLYHDEAVSGQTDPFAKACAQAMVGCDAGLLVHNISADKLRAAIVFAPEKPLDQAMVAMVICAVGFQNAMGALAPPEVAVHLGWNGAVYVNGGKAGHLRVAASHGKADQIPDWLVVGLDIDLIPPAEGEAGDDPDVTCLIMEGCGDVSPIRLLESWSRHTLVWINEVETDGPRALHEAWRGLVKDIGKDVSFTLGTTPVSGTFVGVDEAFGMLLRNGSETDLIPLRRLLDNGDVA